MLQRASLEIATAIAKCSLSSSACFLGSGNSTVKGKKLTQSGLEGI